MSLPMPASRSTSWIARLAVFIVAAVLASGAAFYGAVSSRSAEEASDRVRVVSTGGLDNQQRDLRIHFGWVGAGFFECQSKGSQHQVLVEVDVWRNGKLIETSKGGVLHADPEKLRADLVANTYNSRPGVTVTRYPGNVLYIRKSYSQGDGMWVTNLGDVEVQLPAGVKFDFGDRTVNALILEPGEEKVAWAFAASQKALPDVFTGQQRFVVEAKDGLPLTGREDVDLLIVMRMKLESWVPKDK